MRVRVTSPLLLVPVALVLVPGCDAPAPPAPAPAPPAPAPPATPPPPSAPSDPLAELEALKPSGVKAEAIPALEGVRLSRFGDRPELSRISFHVSATSRLGFAGFTRGKPAEPPQPAVGLQGHPVPISDSSPDEIGTHLSTRRDGRIEVLASGINRGTVRGALPGDPAPSNDLSASAKDLKRDLSDLFGAMVDHGSPRAVIDAERDVPFFAVALVVGLASGMVAFDVDLTPTPGAASSPTDGEDLRTAEALIAKAAAAVPKDGQGLPLLAVEVWADGKARWPVVRDLFAATLKARVWRFNVAALGSDGEGYLWFSRPGRLKPN